MNIRNILLAAGAAIGAASLGYTLYQRYQKEVKPEAKKTEDAKAQAAEDIAAAEAQTEEVRRTVEEHLQEINRQQAWDQAEHAERMATLDRELVEQREHHAKVTALLDELEKCTNAGERAEILAELEALVGHGQAKKFSRVGKKPHRNHTEARRHKRGWE